MEKNVFTDIPLKWTTIKVYPRTKISWSALIKFGRHFTLFHWQNNWLIAFFLFLFFRVSPYCFMHFNPLVLHVLALRRHRCPWWWAISLVYEHLTFALAFYVNDIRMLCSCCVWHKPWLRLHSTFHRYYCFWVVRNANALVNSAI